VDAGGRGVGVSVGVDSGVSVGVDVGVGVAGLNSPGPVQAASRIKVMAKMRRRVIRMSRVRMGLPP
jgi:hypothetical protein